MSELKAKLLERRKLGGYNEKVVDLVLHSTRLTSQGDFTTCCLEAKLAHIGFTGYLDHISEDDLTCGAMYGFDSWDRLFVSVKYFQHDIEYLSQRATRLDTLCEATYLLRDINNIILDFLDYNVKCETIFQRVNEGNQFATGGNGIICPTRVDDAGFHRFETLLMTGKLLTKTCLGNPLLLQLL